MQRSPLAVALLLLTTAILRPSYAQSVAPDFTLTDLDGTRFSLSDFKGRIVLIEFFDTFCRSCKEEIPHLKALSSRYPANAFVIIMIDINPLYDTEEAVRRYVREYGLTWIVVPPSLDTIIVQNKYQVIEIPTLVLIDQQGYIRGRYVGLTEEETLRSKIEVIIPEFNVPWVTMTLALAAALLLLRKRRSKFAIYASPGASSVPA